VGKCNIHSSSLSTVVRGVSCDFLNQISPVLFCTVTSVTRSSLPCSSFLLSVVAHCVHGHLPGRWLLSHYLRLSSQVATGASDRNTWGHQVRLILCTTVCGDLPALSKPFNVQYLCATGMCSSTDMLLDNIHYRAPVSVVQNVFLRSPTKFCTASTI
jgi:hypothetical protein